MSNALVPKTSLTASSKDALARRAKGAYLGLAIGDALGATTEFMTANEVAHEYGVHRNIIGGGWLRLKPGQVTDDTEMSLALGESIIQNKGVKAEEVAEAFSNWMRTKPVDIGHTVRRGIMHYRNSGEVEMPVNEHGAGNGACMRSLPIALYYSHHQESDLLQASRTQAHITHHNQVSDAGTETVLRMVVAALKDASKPQLKTITDQLIAQHPEFQFHKKLVINPGGWIVETLQVVFQSFFKHDNFESILIDVVNRGGDADTTGAIAGMLAGACYGADSIPHYWLESLDQNVRKLCQIQAMQLID